MPPRQPPWKSQMVLACSPAPSTPWLTTEQARVTRPLRSARITRPHHYYGAIRPCAPHRYSASRSSCCLRVSLSRPDAAVSTPRFARSAQEPEPGSRHLHAGRRLGGKQVSPRLIPGQRLLPVSTPSLRFRHAIGGLLTLAFLALT